MFVDISMRLGAGHPMGPLHLADYVGLDTIHSVLSGWNTLPDKSVHTQMPKCLNELVSKKQFGRKSGRGFYQWDGEKIGEPVV